MKIEIEFNGARGAKTLFFLFESVGIMFHNRIGYCYVSKRMMKTNRNVYALDIRRGFKAFQHPKILAKAF
jgi:hypothetical protein